MNIIKNKNVFIDAYSSIKNHIRKTPLELNERLSAKYGCNLYIKREDLQLCRSFKIRGALHKIVNLKDNEKNNGLVCASAGNHAQGVALSSKKFNIEADIFVPSTTPLQKINQIRNQSNPDICKLHITGSTFNDCLEESLEFTDKNSKTFIHPYNDQQVILGQSTIAHEIYDELDKLNTAPDYMISGIGGGGLISGLSQYTTTFRNCIHIGVEPESCPSMAESVKNNELITVVPKDSFVDGATVSRVGDLTFPICQKNVNQYYDISLGKICETMIELYQEDGIISEPAGALSISVLDQLELAEIKDKTVVCILSGGNNDIARYPEILERCLRYQGRKIYYIVQFIQRPGELKTFVNDILSDGDDIVRFEYIKKTNKDCGNVLVGIELDNPNNKHTVEYNLMKYGVHFIEINENDQLYSYLV
jgi:threonine dehydratase